MNDFIKIAGVVLVVLILGLFIKNLRPELSVVLVIAASCIAIIFASNRFVAPVVAFVKELCVSGGLNMDLVMILIKSAGIGIISEIVILICTDAGFAALGKILKFTSVFVIIWISLPLMNELISLINKVMVNE